MRSLSAIAICILLALLIRADGVATPVPDAKGKPASNSQPGKTPVRQLEIQFDQAEEDENRSIGIYTHATIIDGDTVIHCVKAIMHRKDHILDVKGDVTIRNPQADVSGDGGTVDYTSHVRTATLIGNVVMIIKPKKTDELQTKQSASPSNSDNDAEIRKYPLEVHCDKIVYEYAKDKKHALLTGDFHIIQKLPDKTRTLTADHAEWIGLEDKIILYPPVHVQDNKGFQGDTDEQVVILTGKGNDTIKLGKGKAIIPIKEDENPIPSDSGK